MKRLLLIVTLILPFFIFFSDKVSAQEFAVQPVIIIPKDWKTRVTPDTLENLYKPDILSGLKEIQKFYADKLNGKTFKIKETVDVKYSDKEAGDIHFIPSRTTQQHGRTYTAQDVWDLFFRLDGWYYVDLQQDLIKPIWVIGSGNLLQSGRAGDWYFANNKSTGFAMMNHSNLLALNKSTDSNVRRDALGVLAHELGHAVDLVHDGYAKSHPCTQITENECVKGAPRPFPPAEEYTLSIMGTGTYLFPDAGFNNTVFNPEIRKAYLSLFLNPQKDPGPTPSQQSRATIPGLNIAGISKKEVRAGESFEIYGTAFGQVKGNVELFNIHYSQGVKDIIVTDWADNKITVRLLDSYSTPYDLYMYIIVKKSGGSLTAQFKEQIKVAGKRQLIPSIKNTTLLFTTTCGSGKQPLPGAYVKFYQDGFPLAIQARSASSQQGDGSLVGSFYDRLQITVPHVIEAEPIEKLPSPTPKNYTFSPSDLSTYQDKNFSFHYPQCLSGLSTTTQQITQQVAEPIPKEKPVIQKQSQETEDRTDQEFKQEPLSENKLEQIVISDNPEFITQEGESDENIKIIDEPEVEEKIEWDTPQDELTHIREIYSDGTIKDYEAELSEGQIVKIANVEIEAKVVKKVNTVNLRFEDSLSGEKLRGDMEVSHEALSGPLPLSLPALPVRLVVEIYYSHSDSPVYLVYNFTSPPLESIPGPTGEEPITPPTLPEGSPEQPVFSHRKCGGDDGQVTVEVDTQGGEIAGSHCPDLDPNVEYVCQEFPEETPQDARCVPKEE